MNGWRGPVALKLAEQRPLLGGFHQPMQGFYRPAVLRGPQLASVEAFPEIKLLQDVPNTVTGFSPETVKDGIVVGLGGIGLAVVSRFIPGVGEPVTMVGGVGLIGLGLYKIYEAVTGKSTPQIETFNTPTDQKVSDISFIEGKILEPSDGGQADVGSAWEAIFQGKRTFKVKFTVSNTNPDRTAKPMTVLVELRTEQASRPVFGDPEVASFSTSYVFELAPGDTKVVPGYQPIKVLESVFQAQSYRSQDITATLLARTSSRDTGKKLHEIKFTTG